MTYDELRRVAKDGDIFFLTVDKKNTLSRLTSFFTGSKFTHAAFLFWFKERLMVVESTTHGGLRIVTASHYRDREFDLIPAPVDWSLIEEKALEKAGTLKYGWFSALYIGLREFFFMHFDIKLPEDKKNRNKACSEFVSETLLLEETDVSPGKLYKLLKNNEI